MTHRFLRSIWPVLLATTTASCLDLGPVADDDTPIEIKLDFCASELPAWFAVQTGTTPYQILVADAAGTFTFQAKQRTAVAYVQQGASDSHLHLIFTTKGDLEDISGLTCVEDVGSKLVNGAVSGLSGDNFAQVNMSSSSAHITAAQTAFSLHALVDRPVDLVASRYPLPGLEQHANRTVIRRNQSPANNATMATIDFDSEGFLPVTNIATVSGLTVDDIPVLTNSFFSQLGTTHLLSQVEEVEDGPIEVMGVPALETVAGEFHDLFLLASTATGATRGIERFFRIPQDQLLTLGVPLNEPLVTVMGTTPYLRLRTQLNGQLEYSTAVSLDYHQPMQFRTVDVSLTVTASFLGGTPIQWDLPMPLFEDLEGWDNSWGLQDGSNVSWTVTAYFGPPRLLFGASPLDGDAVAFASASSSVSPMLMSGAPRRRPVPRHFSRLR
jgi:hypothetical protein